MDEIQQKYTREFFLDVLKGICIIFVIVEHYAWGIKKLKLLFPFWIAMAVPMFMIISGYAYTKSYERTKVVRLRDAYMPLEILRKIIRYTIPYATVFVLHSFYRAYKGQITISITQMCGGFLTGGYGPGSYYYPIMIQFIFVFPVIFLCIKNYGKRGLLICWITNILYELFQNFFNMVEGHYRLLLFRYIFVIAVGCFFALGYHISKGIQVVMFVVGACFLITTSYMGYEPILFTYWTSTCVLACLYVVPIASILFQRLPKVKRRFWGIEIIGKASFDIFLTQMVYYNCMTEYTYANISNRGLQLLANIFICVTVGVIFYYIENPITTRIMQKVKMYGMQWKDATKMPIM